MTAQMVVLAMPASPLQNIRALRAIDFVMKDGQVVRDGCRTA